MRKTLYIVVAVIALVGMAVLSFGGGFVAGRYSTTLGGHSTPTETPAETPSGETGGEEATTPTREPGAPPRLDTALVNEVLDILADEYYGDIPDDKTLTYGAINGMLATLGDPYTAFVEPNIARILNEDTSGQFEGIGATVRMREDGYLEIVRPLPGQPAEAAGLKSGDLVISVDGESIVGKSLFEAISLIRGPAGTDVTLEIARPGERDTFEVTITRARIEIPVVEYQMLDGDIAYIHLTEFDANAADRVRDALKELLAQHPKGLIFDLRDDPGGLLSQAIEVADIFLDKGVVAIERDSAGHEQVFYSYDGDIGEEIPMVVLVNGGSASASEIVSGALKDRGRAVLIGTRTLGKGSVQLPHQLSDGSQFRVTIARWFTPNDETIHETGIEPDIEVPDPEEPSATPMDDPQVQRAIQYLREGK